MNDIRLHSLHSLQTLLADHFAATAPDFESRVKQAAARLPGDLAGELSELAAAARREGENQDSEAAGRFAFQCGRMYERLWSYRQNQLAAETGTVSPEGVVPEPLAKEQMDALTRIIEVRDRVFRKVADFTLKAILITLGLLALALAFGLV